MTDLFLPRVDGSDSSLSPHWGLQPGIMLWLGAIIIPGKVHKSSTGL